MVDYRNSLFLCQCNQLVAPTSEKSIWADDQRTNTLATQSSKGVLEFGLADDINNAHVLAERTCYFQHVSPI